MPRSKVYCTKPGRINYSDPMIKAHIEEACQKTDGTMNMAKAAKEYTPTIASK